MRHLPQLPSLYSTTVTWMSSGTGAFTVSSWGHMVLHCRTQIFLKKNCGAFKFSLHSPSLKSFTATLPTSPYHAPASKTSVCGLWWHSQSLAYHHVDCLLYDFNAAESVLMHTMARRTLLCKSWEKNCNDGTQLELHDCCFVGFRDAGCHWKFGRLRNWPITSC